MIYVLSLKTWEEFDRAHHTYGRIHWYVPDPCEHGTIQYFGGTVVCTTCGADHSKAGFQVADSELPPDEDGFCSIRHETRESAIAGARRWYAAHAGPDDALVIGTWALLGWDRDLPFEVLEGQVPAAP